MGAGEPAIGGVRADVADERSVDSFFDEALAHLGGLDVLVNNAGIGSGAPELTTRQQSRDGFELRFAINYLAGFRLTLGVLPLLRGSAPARVVLVASRGQHPLDFDDLQITRDYSGQRAYGQSKLAQIMFGFELAGRVPAAEVTANSLHPSSYMPTKMVMQNIGYSIDPLEQGREATARLVSDPALDGVSGRFFNVEKEARPDAQALDASARGLLWNRSLELVGITDPLG